jgi:hypothetical protein
LSKVVAGRAAYLSNYVGGFQVLGDGFMRWDEVTIQS